MALRSQVVAVRLQFDDELEQTPALLDWCEILDDPGAEVVAYGPVEVVPEELTLAVAPGRGRPQVERQVRVE